MLNCYILYCRGTGKAVSAFWSRNLLDVINDCNEKDSSQLAPEGKSMFSSQVSRRLDINAEEDDVEYSIESC